MTLTTNQPVFVRHTYIISKELLTYSVFTIVEVNGNKNLLTETLRVEKFNNKSKASNIDHYLRLRTATSWEKSEKVTGLRPTNVGIFYGDRIHKITNKKSLLLFTFTEDGQRLLIDVYKDFYPYSPQVLHSIISTYQKR